MKNETVIPLDLTSPNPLLIVLSGPSGVGKDVTLKRMKELGYPLHFVVTVTTRPKRPGEIDGVDYHFISMEAFQRMLEGGELLEHANVFGHYYGVPKQEVRKALARGEDVLLRIDVQGAATIKKIVPHAVFIFLAPPSMEELIQRLEKRKTESAEKLERRIRIARDEIKALPNYDYVVVNRDGRLDETVKQIAAIVTAEKCRVRPRKIEL